jgi:hypothetical protein
MNLTGVKIKGYVVESLHARETFGDSPHFEDRIP